MGTGAGVTPGGDLSSTGWQQARWGQEGACWPCILLPPHSPGQIHAGPSAGKAGAGASEQWAQVAERAGARAQREGRKWQLPQPSPHPTAWTDGRMALVLVCQGALRA